MSRKIVLIDDLDGTSEADETITFTLDGVTTEIDLSSQNANNLRKAFAEYVSAGRTASGSSASRAATSVSRGSSRPKSDPSHLADVRTWANENGFKVSSRGRVPRNVMDAYEDAHK